MARFQSVTVGAILILAAGIFGAQAQTVGFAVPRTDALALLSVQMAAGARAAARTASVELAVEDDGCSAEGGARAARAFVEQGVSVVAGFLCTAALESALPVLTGAGIPVIATGVRTNSITDRRERTGWSVFRMGPRADGEVEEAARLVVEGWRDVPFAIVDDGTIYGRELAEGVRLAAEQSGLAPVFVDTYRPLLDNQIGLAGRLVRAGATHVFVGGEREDAAIIARDAAELGPSVTIAGGEALRGPGMTPLPDGVLMVAADWALPADDPDAADPERQGYFAPSQAAVEVAAAALAALDGREVGEVLAGNRFSTLLGPVAFDGQGDMEGRFWHVWRLEDGRFERIEE